MDRIITNENAIGFYFETNEPVPIGVVARFLLEIERIARQKRNFGPLAVIEIVEIRAGSLWVEVLANSAGLAGLTALALQIYEKLTTPRRNHFAEMIAEMAIDHAIVRIDIVTRDNTLQVYKSDLPWPRAKADRRQGKLPLRPGQAEAGIEYGDPVQADPIVLDGGPATPVFRSEQRAPDANKRTIVIDRVLVSADATISDTITAAGTFIDLNDGNPYFFRESDRKLLRCSSAADPIKVSLGLQYEIKGDTYDFPNEIAQLVIISQITPL